MTTPAVSPKASVREASAAHAEFLNAIVAAFGRPQAVRVVVVVEGRVVWQYGQFDDEREHTAWEGQ